MFTVYHSNDIELLVKLGIHLIKNSNTDHRKVNPFAPSHFIVQSSGMELYLKQKIAEFDGVCARIECHLPWKFIWSLHEALFADEYPHEMVYNGDNIAWILLQAFSEGAKNDPDCFNPDSPSCRYQYVADYIYDRDETASGNSAASGRKLNYVKCYRLAHRLAYIYENYLVYRQDWIRSWNDAPDKESLRDWLEELKVKHNTDFNNNDFVWIGELWHEFVRNNLIDELKGKDRIHYMDSMRAVMQNSSQEEFFERIRNNGKDIPRDVYVYGISSIAPVVLEFLVLLGKFINVHFMFTNPCRYYWGDIKADNGSSSDSDIDELIERIKQRHSIDLKIKNRNITDEYFSKLNSQDTGDYSDFSSQNFSRDYYEHGDDMLELVESNRLLLTYGKSGKDTLSSLMAYADNENYQVNDIHAFVENNGESGTMLSLIKNDLLNMTFTPMTGDPDTMEQANVSRKQRMVDPDDSSIQFHSCATPLREVQVLYDHMLEKFREDKTLRPRDIAVFMPNVGVYAPYIEAVFGTNRELLTKKNSGAADKNAEPQKVDLPYTICDRTTAEECPEIDGFNKLMNIVSGRIDNKTLFMLLSIDAIRSRFGIEADDLEQIKKWFNDNNIVFGLDEEDTNIYDVNVSADKKDSGTESNPFFVSEYRNSFKSGLNRMINGSLMPVLSEGDDDHEYNTELEGTDSFELLGHLYSFYDALKSLRLEFKECESADKEMLTIPEDIIKQVMGDSYAGSSVMSLRDLSVAQLVSYWHNFIISRVLNRFFAFSENNVNLYTLIARNFERMRIDLEKLKDIPVISLDIVREYLADKLSGESGFSAFLRDKVNFCSFIPMRAIPFKHIFMLGMNDGDYPKSDNGDYFDLMKTYFRHGDRNVRNDDCYMFMEALISAEKSVYISYVGKDVVKNNELNPSMLVSELINYISSTCMLNRDSFERLYHGKNEKTYEEYQNEADSTENEEMLRKALVKSESLNVYDASNFNGTRLRSYQSQWCPRQENSTNQEGKELWQNFITPELSSLKFIKKDDEHRDGFADCDYVLDISTDELQTFFESGKKFFVKNVMRLSHYLLDQHGLTEHEGWRLQFGESDIERHLMDRLFKPGIVTNEDIRNGIDDFIYNAQLKGTLENGVIGEYYKENVLGDADSDESPFCRIRKIINLRNSYYFSNEPFSVPVDLKVKVPVEKRFIADLYCEHEDENNQANNSGKEDESCLYTPGETVNVEVRIRGKIDDVLKINNKYLKINFRIFSKFSTSLFISLYQSLLLYLQLADSNGKADVSVQGIWKLSEDYRFQIDFYGTRAVDELPKIVKNYDDNLRKLLEEKLKNLIRLYILGHYAYIPFELIKKISSGVFSTEGTINSKNKYTGSSYISETDLLFGDQPVSVTDFNMYNGSPETMFSCIDWLVGDLPFVEKFVKKDKKSSGKADKNEIRFLTCPTKKQQIVTMDKLLKEFGIDLEEIG